MFPPSTRILVLDDMQSIRDLVKGHLRSLGYQEIFEAENGQDGLKILIEKYAQSQPIQLVVSDWNMPVMTGLELLKQVRASSTMGQLPFVLLTSEAERDQVTEAVLAGASQYIVKPFSGKVLEDKLKGVWAKLKK